MNSCRETANKYCVKIHNFWNSIWEPFLPYRKIFPDKDNTKLGSKSNRNRSDTKRIVLTTYFHAPSLRKCSRSTSQWETNNLSSLMLQSVCNKTVRRWTPQLIWHPMKRLCKCVAFSMPLLRIPRPASFHKCYVVSLPPSLESDTATSVVTQTGHSFPLS